VKYLQRIARGQAGARLISCQSRQERMIDRSRQLWHLLAFGETNDETKKGREPLLLLSASDKVELTIDCSRSTNPAGLAPSRTRTAIDDGRRPAADRQILPCVTFSC